MKDMVDHPAHYEKGDGHIECIDLLDFLTEHYKGIFAMEIGQFKYLYRAGSKNEEGLSSKEKTIQDVKKLVWYMNDFYKRLLCLLDKEKFDECECSFLYAEHKPWNQNIVNILEREFSYDKPEIIQEDIKRVVNIAYRITKIGEVKKIIEILEIIIKKLETN